MIIGEKLSEKGKLHISAGCAGFGTVLPILLGWEKKEQTKLPELDRKLHVICGSVNPITTEQLQLAEENGFHHYRIPPERKLHSSMWGTEEDGKLLKELNQLLSQHCYLIIDTNDADSNESTRQYAKAHNMSTEDIRLNISSTMGQNVSNLINSPAVYGLDGSIRDGARRRNSYWHCPFKVYKRWANPICDFKIRWIWATNINQ